MDDFCEGCEEGRGYALRAGDRRRETGDRRQEKTGDGRPERRRLED